MIKGINFKKRIMGWYKIEFSKDYLGLFWIHPIFFFEFIFLGGMIKNEEICGPMEKIWVKKELYKESYEFLNFMEFFRFYFDFSDIFQN